MARIEPDDQLTADRGREAATAATTRRSWARPLLVLYALAVTAAAVIAAWALGLVAALGIYVAGILALVAALLILTRGARRQ